MSGLSVGPIVQISNSSEALSTPLLTSDTPVQKETRQTPTADSTAQKPLHSPAWTGDLTHYQAQVIGAELAKSYGRRPAKASPRDAARAYGQSRRRPETMVNRPRLRSVM